MSGCTYRRPGQSRGVYSDDLEAHAGDLAYHLSHAGRSGDRASLVHYLTIAGERAFDAAAFDDAVGHFEKALSLMPNDDQLGRAQLLERLAMALRSVGRWEDALGTMNDALDRYEALGQVEAIGRLGWAMVYQLVWTARLVEGVQVGQRTLAALGNTVSADKARLLSALAFAISVSGDYAAATATFNQARALAEQVGNERAMADVLHMQTIHHFVYAEFAEGVRVGLRAAETFERESALWDLCSVQAFVIFEDGNLGSREQATSLADKTLGLAERLGHLGAAFMVLSDRIRVAAMLGDLPQVEALGPQIVDIGERGGLPWRYFGHLYLGLAAHRRGNAERAEAQLRNAVELEPPGAFAGQSAAMLARHLAYHGRADEVMELFESARSKLPSLDRVNGIGSWSCMLNFVEAFYLCGLHEEAAALSPLIEGVLELDKRWISYRRPASGDPCRSRRRGGSSVGGSRTPLRHRPRGRRADVQPGRAGRPMPPTRPDAVGSRRHRRPRACRRDAPGGSVRLPHLRHACLRRQRRNAYAVRRRFRASRGPDIGQLAERCQQRRTPSKIICAGQVGQRNEDRTDPKIGELPIALRMINRQCRMVAGGVDRGRRTSAEPLHPD